MLRRRPRDQHGGSRVAAGRRADPRAAPADGAEEQEEPAGGVASRAGLLAGSLRARTLRPLTRALGGIFSLG